jgi:hypothetical protein
MYFCRKTGKDKKMQDKQNEIILYQPDNSVRLDELADFVVESLFSALFLF